MEFHEMLAQWAWRGKPACLVVREGLRDTHLAYVQNCNDGLPHDGAVAGTMALAYALYGWDTFADAPYWSNNHRRRCGLGPMPLRGILRYRRRNRG